MAEEKRNKDGFVPGQRVSFEDIQAARRGKQDPRFAFEKEKREAAHASATPKKRKPGRPPKAAKPDKPAVSDVSDSKEQEET